MPFPPGHFYSPIVNPHELLAGNFRLQQQLDKLTGVEFDYDLMEAHFRSLMDTITDVHLPHKETPGWRYYSENDMYGIGDASILCGTLRHFRSKRWVEIGSGFSTAALLDVVQRTPGLDIELTVIDPDLGRVRRLCSETDLQGVRLIEDIVQNVSVEVFEALSARDVLFLDTNSCVQDG